MQRECKSVRSVYGKTLAELGKENENIVVLDADLSCSTQTQIFAKEFPDRFFNAGIAEQDMMTTAAGLACTGKTVFVSTFAMFASGRAWEQIRNTICYSNLNVKICATHGGITVGEDGASHQALEDISLMRSIPNMTVIVPADANETKQAVELFSVCAGMAGEIFALPVGEIGKVLVPPAFFFHPGLSSAAHILSGALTPRMERLFSITWRVQSASSSRARATSGSAPLIRHSV